MCVPGCAEVVQERLSRRNFFLTSAASAAALAITGCSVKSAAAPVAPASGSEKSVSFSRVVDLTHTLEENFPTYGGKALFSRKQFSKLKKDGYNSYTWTLFEHIGTHVDSPMHFSDTGHSVDLIPANDLVVPLFVLDLRAKAAADPDAVVTVEDLKHFEAAHGPISEGSCVAMNSGWAQKLGTKEFRNADAKGVMHFPGFHHEAAVYLAEERKAGGIAVDTLSLDPGNSKDFSAHYHWLPTNRWGIECLGNLQDLPPTGATIVVGAPKVARATGGPSRVFALI